MACPSIAAQLGEKLGIAGGAPGINAAVEVDRESGWVVIVLTNEDLPMATGAARQVRRLLNAVTR